MMVEGLFYFLTILLKISTSTFIHSGVLTGFLTSGQLALKNQGGMDLHILPNVK